jgi:hypothetical protein
MAFFASCVFAVKSAPDGLFSASQYLFANPILEDKIPIRKGARRLPLLGFIFSFFSQHA